MDYLANKIMRIIFWFLSICLILTGLICITIHWSYIFIALSGVIINPKFTNIVKNKIKRKLNWWMPLVSFILCFILLLVFFPSIEKSDELNNTQPLEQTSQATEDSITTIDTEDKDVNEIVKVDEELISNIENNNIDDNVDALALKANDELQTELDLIEISGNLKVHFLDVGQGDSIFVEMPNKQTLLIDAGNSNNSYTIINYIKNLGYISLDYVVATHPHADHIGSMGDVVDSFDIGKFYMPKVSHTTKTFEDMLLSIQNKGLKINAAKSGINMLDNNNLKIDILAPVRENYDNLNNYSAVIKLQYKDVSFLFTGDAENESEYEITSLDIDSDVLKIGHHGSDSSTSSNFISKVDPKYAVISVGAENSYGHPTFEVLKRLDDKGIKIYRTDESGTIIFTTDGNDISVDKKTSEVIEPILNSETIQTTQDYDSTPIANEGYIGNKNTLKFHRISCSSLPATKNQVIFNTKDEAIASGYVGCKRCNP